MEPVYDVDFEKELRILLNKYSIDARCNTPDYVLAKYLTEIIKAHSICIFNNEEAKTSVFIS